MSFYQNISKIGPRIFSKHSWFKHMFNLSPMYRRTTARVIEVSKDLMHVRIKLPINYKNKNYVGTIFGGSMFSAVDPFPMVQLVSLMGEDYIIWDKSAEIFFKRPATEDLYADFNYSNEEVEALKKRISIEKELVIEKLTQLMSRDGTKIYCEVVKKIYVAEKSFYKEKRKQKRK